MSLLLSTIPDLTPYVTKKGAYPAAHGGFADIWMCTLSNEAYPSITQHVAVKVLRSLGGAFNDEDKHEKRLRRELAVWLKLKHPQVLPLYGIVSDFGPYPSMVCPWMDRGNLNNYLSGDGQSLNVEGRYKISALDWPIYTPAQWYMVILQCNVLINGDGDACLSDFGLSTIISDLQGVSTFTSSIGGNVRFAAPELYEVGDDDIRTFPTARSDIYSLGSVILQTLTGVIPYHYMRTDGQVLIELSRGVHPRRPQDPIVTEARWGLLCACWERDPLRRPTLEAVAECLEGPERIFRAAPPALAHITGLHRDSMINLSHGRKMESWTAHYEDRVVAVKMFRIPWSTLEKGAALQEMQNIGQIEHDHLLAYVATTEYDGFPGVVMPWLSTFNLCSYLPNTYVPVSRKIVLLRQIASALSHLHSTGLVHGGMTGWNILITDDGEAKLSNFGIMPILYRHTEPSKMSETYDEDCRWADPILWFERTDGKSRPSETFATDIYAFGRVVYQIMTNEAPFYDPCDDMKKFRSLLKNYTVATFRPPIPSNQLGDIWKLAGDCWEVDHRKRPTMQMIISRLSTIATPPPTSSWTVRMGHQSIPFDRTTAQRDDGPRVE
ncbi:hypothetical protein CCMSSC00406_0001344 [Pleurotus cornucopiae]|uniref:Uncharacterized protein n=1 Tax=Pleurotus cornucopiae TaxID=5321 RepID=A0ACB7IK05_PLECO|nr:hypothetical protein CCMSSC00406_0001344 [Pleurotus cornucopiae]